MLAALFVSLGGFAFKASSPEDDEVELLSGASDLWTESLLTEGFNTLRFGGKLKGKIWSWIEVEHSVIH